MEPHEAIYFLEVILRDLIRSELGDSWRMDFTEEDMARLDAKREEEVKKRSGSIVSRDLLDYTEFTQVQRVITKHHETFAPALGRKKHVEDTWRRLNGLRNPTMHSRGLLPFERDLLNGLVGEIRNQVTLYRSTKGPDMEYYPIIESVTDSFGRSASSGHPDLTSSTLRVAPGAEVTFVCRGTDPRDRALTWELRPNNDLRYGSSITANDAELVWHVSADLVREGLIVWVRLTSAGAYHRMGVFDAEVAFRFDVDPPLP